jgi:HK97 family phage major capsid protein
MRSNSRSIVLRKIDGVFGAVWRGNTPRGCGGSRPYAVGGFGMLILTLLIVAITAVLSHAPDLVAHASAFEPQSLGFAGMALAGTLTKKKEDLAKLYKELAKGEEEIKAGTVTEARGAELEAKAQEAENLQKEVDQAERIGRLAAKGREIDETILPETKDKGSKAGIGHDGSEIVGYMSVGQLFTGSDSFKNYLKSGMSKGLRAAVGVKGFNDRFLPITQKMVEQKAVPTIDSGVIRPDRIALVAQETADDRTVLRDVINVSQTDGSSVEYVIEDAYTGVAEPVAESAIKPEATMGLSLGTAPVRTLAVHMPVTEQQLQDVPQMQNLIDNRLRYDLRKLEEKQIMYGAGTGQNLAGILPLAGVAAITRSAPADTQNLDRVRIGVTDVLVNGYEPNALVVHPYDWEAMVLLKATGKEYLWTIVTDPVTGNSRIWGLQVVESVAAKNPASAQRYMLVGDFRRGATLWDRQQATVEVGYIDDQFIHNLRTIRAEERIAFGVHAPKAFVKYETNAA